MARRGIRERGRPLFETGQTLVRAGDRIGLYRSDLRQAGDDLPDPLEVLLRAHRAVHKFSQPALLQTPRVADCLDGRREAVEARQDPLRLPGLIGRVARHRLDEWVQPAEDLVEPNGRVLDVVLQGLREIGHAITASSGSVTTLRGD